MGNKVMTITRTFAVKSTLKPVTIYKHVGEVKGASKCPWHTA